MIQPAYAHQSNVSAQMLKRLKRRSGLIWVLRLIVLMIGAGLMLVLLWPVILDFVLPSASFEGIRISDSRLVVDAPKSKGTMADGGHYEFDAQTASSEITNQDLVYLDQMLGTFYFADETVVRATSDKGEYLFSTEVLTLLTQIDIFSSKGDEGVIGSGTANIKTQQFNGADGVKFRFIDGTKLDADTMFYDAGRNLWKFTNATLVMDAE